MANKAKTAISAPAAPVPQRPSDMVRVRAAVHLLQQSNPKMTADQARSAIEDLAKQIHGMSSHPNPATRQLEAISKFDRAIKDQRQLPLTHPQAGKEPPAPYREIGMDHKL